MSKVEVVIDVPKQGKPPSIERVHSSSSRSNPMTVTKSASQISIVNNKAPSTAPENLPKRIQSPAPTSSNTPSLAHTSSQQVQNENNQRLSSTFDSDADSDRDESDNELYAQTFELMDRRTARVRDPASSPPAPPEPSASQSFSPLPSQLIRKLTGSKLQSLTSTGVPPRMSSPYSSSQMATPVVPNSATPRPQNTRWRSLDQLSQAELPEVREQHAAIKQVGTPTPGSQIRGSLLSQNVPNDSDDEEESSSSSSGSGSSSDESSSEDSDEEGAEKKQHKKRKRSSNIPAEKSASAAAKKSDNRKSRNPLTAFTSLLKFGAGS